MKSNNLEDRLVDFAVRIINLTTNLKNHEASLIIKRQIIRSSTSSALNYGEVQGAQSNRDFIHKLQIVLKEFRETRISLKIIIRACLIKNSDEANVVMKENNELISIFIKSVNTTKNKYT